MFVLVNLYLLAVPWVHKGPEVLVGPSFLLGPEVLAVPVILVVLYIRADQWVPQVHTDKNKSKNPFGEKIKNLTLEHVRFFIGVGRSRGRVIAVWVVLVGLIATLLDKDALEQEKQWKH